jgi:hypothetical protein
MMMDLDSSTTTPVPEFADSPESAPEVSNPGPAAQPEARPDAAAQPEPATRLAADDGPPVPLAPWLLQQNTLAPGENVDDLTRLIIEVEDALKPKSLFERFEATDLVNAAWEERRYSRQRVALTTAMRFKAFVCLVTPLDQAYHLEATAAAYDYFASTPERHTKVAIQLAKFAINEAAIDALAATFQSETMALLDRRIASAKSQRNIVVKEFQRRQRKAEKPKGRKPDVSSESRGLPH